MKICKEIGTDLMILVGIFLTVLVVVAMCSPAEGRTLDYTERSWLIERENNMWDLRPEAPETWSPRWVRERKAPRWTPMQIERPDWRVPNVDGCYLFLDCNER